MKLEILKDNKATQARVGTIMTVPEKKGMEWIKKGCKGSQRSRARA